MIEVKSVPPGYMITLPPFAAHVSESRTGVTLSRDEAFDLLGKLRETLAADLGSSLKLKAERLWKVGDRCRIPLDGGYSIASVVRSDEPDFITVSLSNGIMGTVPRSDVRPALEVAPNESADERKATDK